MSVLFAINDRWRRKLFAPADEGRIAQLARVLPAPIPSQADHTFLRRHIAEAEIVITGWETAALDAAVLDAAPRLKLLTHAGGSVKSVVSAALWAREVRVTSAAAALGIGVAEFCLGMILVASKRAFWAGLHTRAGGWQDGGGLDAFHGPHEIYQQEVGIIGAGFVGRHLIRLLRQFECRLLLYDPYCPAARARELGAEKVATLDELFRRCRVVSLNAASTPETRQMLRGRHFQLLPAGALFINTARAALIHEEEFIAELRTGRFVACLDVTTQEPPPPDHPFRQLPNVWLTPHEAGAVAENILRIGTFVANEIEAFVAGQPLQFEVRPDQLATMA